MSSESLPYLPYRQNPRGDDVSEKSKMLANADDAERNKPHLPAHVYLSKLTIRAFIASMVFAATCIIAGAVFSQLTHAVSYKGPVIYSNTTNNATAGVQNGTIAVNLTVSANVEGIIPVLSPSPHTITVSTISLTFSIIATIFTEIIGFVHSTALRSALIAEGRLDFNTNTRLFTAAKGWASPNGWLLNALMALLLVMSYASSALVVMRFQMGVESTVEYQAWLTAPPIIVLGVSIFLQGVIALFGAYHCGPALLESTGVLDTTQQQIEHGDIVPRPHRCMRNVLQGQSTTPDPLEPLALQPSAWRASLTVKRAVFAVWCLIPVYTIWGATVDVLGTHASDLGSTGNSTRNVFQQLANSSWAFFPNSNSQAFSVQFLEHVSGAESASLPKSAWPLILLAFMAIQSSLTLVLHYCEVIINTTRDEKVWRQAAGGKGAAISQAPLIAALGNWRSVFLVVTKPLLHWMFGLSFTVVGTFSTDGYNTSLEMAVTAACVQTWYLSIALVGFATITTLIANNKPPGPQPAAYGHFQTLADLIDEWPLGKLYWGHKADKDDVCHAGTSGKPLPEVQMGRMYAGELDQKSSSTANTQSE
ncbi:hypothetical protein FIBSPDRAFT_929599 [Athelia psychrophila]|uniref:Uncharacterized protein n=1 Tax=Athelia psychrophila TaxID=1759441 RepID=A0A166NIZ9_9AGAM|nr:hypothetical protein FIBSPDRAFT_929599 [Fibularhizoctonia sp. CBS 109695]